MQNTTLKDIAERTDLTVASVSLALRNSTQVSKATQERVKAVAEELNYIPRPALAAAASNKFRNSASDGTESVAYLWFVESDIGAFDHAQLLFNLLTESGKALGYQFKNYPCMEEDLPTLLRTLHKQGVVGIVLGPWIGQPPPLCPEWKFFSVVGMGGMPKPLPFHFVEEDLFRSAAITIEQAFSRGYRRIGMAPLSHVPRIIDDDRRLGGLISTYIKLAGHLPEIPPLLSSMRDQQAFADWVKTYQPDCIISFHRGCYFWLQEIGVNIPEEIAQIFLHTDPEYVHEDAEFQFSGMTPIDPLAADLAMEMLSQAYRLGERGPADSPRRIFISSKWQDGTTLPKEKPPKP